MSIVLDILVLIGIASEREKEMVLGNHKKNTPADLNTFFNSPLFTTAKTRSTTNITTNENDENDDFSRVSRLNRRRITRRNRRRRNERVY